MPDPAYTSLPAITDYTPDSLKAWVTAATQILLTLTGAKPEQQAGRACTVFTTYLPASTVAAPTPQPVGAKEGDLWVSIPTTALQGVGVSIWLTVNGNPRWVPITSNWSAGGGGSSGPQAFQ